MSLSKDNRNLIMYFRYSLSLGPISAIAFLLITVFGTHFPTAAISIALLALLSCIPGYLILPGLLYENFKTGMTFTVDQMCYFLFTLLTMGIWPSFIYFSKYDPVLRKMASRE